MTFPFTTQLPVVISAGVNTKIQQFSLQQPHVLVANNYRYTSLGHLDQRTGFTYLANSVMGGGNISQGAKLTTFNEELILLDGQAMYSWQPEEQVWVSKGSCFSTTSTQQKVLNTKTAIQDNPDAVTANGITYYCWEDNRAVPSGQNGVRYSVINQQTGNVIVNDKLVYPFGTRPKVISDGTNFYNYYLAAVTSIVVNIVPISKPNTVPVSYQLVCTDGYSVDNPASSIAYDVTLFNGSPLICYCSGTGIKVIYNNATYTLGLSELATCIAVAIDSNDNLWLSFSDGASTYIRSYNFASNAFHPNFALTTIIGLSASNIGLIEDAARGNANLTLEFAQANLNNYCNNYLVQNTGGFNLIGQIRSVGLVSKPFRYNNLIFINTVNASNLQATYFTHCLSQGLGFTIGTANIQAGFNKTVAIDFTIVAKHAFQNGGGYRTNSLLSECSLASSNAFLFAGQKKGPFTSFQNSQEVALGCTGYSVAFDNSYNCVPANNNLHITGGVKKIYDGVSCTEDNFHLFPELADGFGCDIVITNGAGNLTYSSMFTSVYQWLVVYEWTDNNGQVQRSGPSVANTAQTSQAGQGAVLTGPTLRLTDKLNARTPVSITIYRTQVNLPIFYKITNDENPLVNDPTVDSWTFTDTLSDTDIGANENLYIDSQLPNIAPPSCSLISLYQNRVMINSTEDVNVLWYSQNKFEQDQYNTLALDWNTNFVEGVDNRAGSGITALGLLDNSLAIFKETSIFILEGDGPNALGTSGAFNDARLLVSDCGCSNPNSLVFITQTPSTPGGLMFQSKKGIYLLGRDTSLTYIGDRVEAYNNLTITSANILSKSNEVVFTSLEGTMLVYNYYFDVWTTWSSIPAVSATVWQDQLVILQPNGTAMVQDITNTIFIDRFNSAKTVPVIGTLTLPWITSGSMQGYQGIYSVEVLGSLAGPHLMTASIAYDYNPSIIDTVGWNSSTAANHWGGLPIWGSLGIWGASTFANYQYQINFSNVRCQALQLTLTSTNIVNSDYPNGSGCVSWNGFQFEILPLPGSMRLPASNIYGAGNNIT